MRRNNVGRIITDFYCGGSFGRNYDLSGAIIIAEGKNWIVIRLEDGRLDSCFFQNFDWNRHENGDLSGGICNLMDWDDDRIQEEIDGWCSC